MTAARSPSGTDCVSWNSPSIVKWTVTLSIVDPEPALQTARALAWKTSVSAPYASAATRTGRNAALTGSRVPGSAFSTVGPEIIPTQCLGVGSTPVMVTGTDALLWNWSVTSRVPPGRHPNTLG